MPSVDTGRGLTFGRVAAAYDRWRPGYPSKAVDWLAPVAPARVADVGAGTGKLTGSLIERGLRIEAVDADADMLAVLTRVHPTARAYVALAHVLPFADATLDAVLVADAWHWFPFDETVAEVRRVLKPGGWLGLVWNIVTPKAAWEYELAGIDPDKKGLEHEDSPRLPFPTAETDTANFPWTWNVTPRHFRGYLATNSAVITMNASQRRRRLDAAEDLLEKIRGSHGTATVGLHHEAACVRWTPRRTESRTREPAPMRDTLPR